VSDPYSPQKENRWRETAARHRGGSFLDVGCANGYLLESLVAWSPHRLEPYGLEIAPELAALARSRLPQWAERIFVGNALDWQPPQRFTFVRTNLEYVPPRRRCELVARLLGYADRVVVGVYNEQRHERPTEELLRAYGFEVAGRHDAPHPTKSGIDYRVVWISLPRSAAPRRGSGRRPGA
jgi:SAM-dependent methyltransferase